MPRIQDHSNPFAAVLANAGASADDLAQFLEHKKKDDFYMQRAQEQMALQRAQDQREQELHDYVRQRQPALDAQQDARAKIDQAAGEQRLKLGEQTLAFNEKKLRPNQDTLARDNELQLFGQDAETYLTGLDDSPELGKIRGLTDTRLGLLRRYADVLDQNEPDPVRRSAMLKKRADEFRQMTENEALPLMRSTVARQLEEASSRGHLQANPARQAAVEQRRARLAAGEDPRTILHEHQIDVAKTEADTRFLEDAQYSASEIDNMIALSPNLPPASKSALRALKHSVAVGSVKPDDAVEQARKIALGGTATPEMRLRAREQALRELRSEYPDTVDDKLNKVPGKYPAGELDRRTKMILGEPVNPVTAPRDELQGGIDFFQNLRNELDGPNRGQAIRDVPETLGGTPGGSAERTAQPTDPAASGTAPVSSEARLSTDKRMPVEQPNAAAAGANQPTTRAAVVKRPVASPEEWNAMVTRLATLSPQEKIRALHAWPYNPFVVPPGANELPMNQPGSVLDKKPEEPGLMDKVRGAVGAMGSMLSRMRGR